MDLREWYIGLWYEDFCFIIWILLKCLGFYGVVFSVYKLIIRYELVRDIKIFWVFYIVE